MHGILTAFANEFESLACRVGTGHEFAKALCKAAVALRELVKFY